MAMERAREFPAGRLIEYVSTTEPQKTILRYVPPRDDRARAPPDRPEVSLRVMPATELYARVIVEIDDVSGSYRETMLLRRHDTDLYNNNNNNNDDDSGHNLLLLLLLLFVAILFRRVVSKSFVCRLIAIDRRLCSVRL